MNELTPQQIEQAFQMIIGSIIAIACVAGAALLVWGKYEEWSEARQDNDTNILSSTALSKASESGLSPQTDRPQTVTDNADSVKVAISEEQRAAYLELFRVLRSVGMSREKARPMLKAAGIALDNNLWAEAAPTREQPIEDVRRTPIVGRPTSAVFEEPPPARRPEDYHEDAPELRYAAPQH